jgi:hypothetical protein
MMTSLVGLNRSMIIDALINDDIFILLEELNSMSDKESFKAIIEPALARLPKTDSKYILKVLQEGFDYLDSTFKKNKKVIILFLSDVYPTEAIANKTDVALLEYMMNIYNMYQEHKK